MNFINVSTKFPCQICGKPDWCSRSSDGHFIICRRVLGKNGLKRVDRSGAEYYLYKVSGGKNE